MIVREITAGSLTEFINSKEYAQLTPKPITPLRAVSQSKNPAGNPDDIALVYMAEGDKLLAFAGLLADETSDTSKPVYSNSGWWVHPELGKKYGLSVFMKAFLSCNRRMFFTDCTAYTKGILEKTGMFHFNRPVEGRRFILRAYLKDYYRNKGTNRLFSGLFSAVDSILNLYSKYSHDKWVKRNMPQGYSLSTVDRIDDELNGFILKHSDRFYLRQYGAKLNWIVQNQWLHTDKKATLVPYPFSRSAESFNQEFIVIRAEHQIVGLMFLSWRDDHVSVPYVYYEGDHLSQVLVLCIGYMFKKKAKSVVVFQQELLSTIISLRMPSLTGIKVVRYFGYSNDLTEEFSGNRKFQDGEGDAAFT